MKASPATEWRMCGNHLTKTGPEESQPKAPVCGSPQMVRPLFNERAFNKSAVVGADLATSSRLFQRGDERRRVAAEQHIQLVQDGIAAGVRPSKPDPRCS